MSWNPGRLAAGVTVAMLACLPPGASADALRIVTLAPHAAELAAAAGAADRLVGVAAFTDRPPGAAALPVVADARGLDREQVIALQPDLVVAWPDGNRPTDLEWLAARGIRIFESRPVRIDDIPREVRALARLAGTADTGDAAARRLQAKLDEMRATHAGDAPVTWFFQLWARPPMTFGGSSLVTRALAECGGINVFTAVTRESFTPDAESLRQVVPDVEIIPEDLGAARPLTAAPRALRVTADGLYRPGPGFVAAVGELCEGLRERAGSE